jgi:hypothetical protein
MDRTSENRLSIATVGSCAPFVSSESLPPTFSVPFVAASPTVSLPFRGAPVMKRHHSFRFCQLGNCTLAGAGFPGVLGASKARRKFCVHGCRLMRCPSRALYAHLAIVEKVPHILRAPFLGWERAVQCLAHWLLSEGQLSGICRGVIHARKPRQEA